jgi:hypothetical protein
MKCKIKTNEKYDDYPHKVFGVGRETSMLLQNFLNTLAISDVPLNVDTLEEVHCLWISDAEYKALLDNAELLGIKFIVEGA